MRDNDPGKFVVDDALLFASAHRALLDSPAPTKDGVDVTGAGGVASCQLAKGIFSSGACNA